MILCELPWKLQHAKKLGFKPQDNKKERGLCFFFFFLTNAPRLFKIFKEVFVAVLGTKGRHNNLRPRRFLNALQVSTEVTAPMALKQ